jgi:hypothetical protein
VVRLAPLASQRFVRALHAHGGGGDGDNADGDGGASWAGSSASSSETRGELRVSLSASAHVGRCWAELLEVARGGEKAWPLTRAARRKALLALLATHGHAAGSAGARPFDPAAAAGAAAAAAAAAAALAMGQDPGVGVLEGGQDLDRARLLAAAWRDALPAEPPAADAASSPAQSAASAQAAQRRRKRPAPQAWSHAEL